MSIPIFQAKNNDMISKGPVRYVRLLANEVQSRRTTLMTRRHATRAPRLRRCWIVCEK